MPEKQNKVQLPSNNQVMCVSARRDLTHPQNVLLELITSKIESCEPITNEDIFEAYFKAYPRKTVYIYNRAKKQAEWRNMEWVYSQLDNDSIQKRNFEIYELKTCAFPWFKQNIGALVFKGKLFAIPKVEVVEI